MNADMSIFQIVLSIHINIVENNMILESFVESIAFLLWAGDNSPGFVHEFYKKLKGLS